MYGEFFNIDENAFSIAPNPKYLFLSDQHEEALAHLLYGVTRSGGFVLITGEIGTGKTTVCRSLFLDIPEDTDIALIVNPKLNPDDLLASICDELHISYPEYNLSPKAYLNKLNERLIQSHANGRNTILIIDEAQNLSIDCLETIRALTNLETDEQKLLQIILMGQPELKGRLDSKELEQLNQRITARFHLIALSKSEVKQYISHRLTVGGCNDELFTSSNINQIYKLTGGIPRLINVLCDRALLGAFVQKKKIISNDIIHKSAAEALGKTGKKPIDIGNSALIIASLVVITVTLAIFLKDKDLSSLVDKRETEMVDTFMLPVKPQMKVVEIPEVKPEIKTQETGVNEDVKSNDIVNEELVEGIKPIEASLVVNTNEQDISVELSAKQWAYQSLFKSWGIEYVDFAIKPCDFAQINGLFCYPGVGDAALLQRLNRPVLLKKNTSNKEESYLFVKKIDRDHVIVVEQSGEYTVSWDQIAQSWRGRYDLLWKPVADIKFIRPGMQGSFVKDIDNNLATVFNRPPRLNAYDVYSPSLVKEVVSFQRAQKIPSDGVIGPLTQIYMNNLVREDVPKLR